MEVDSQGEKNTRVLSAHGEKQGRETEGEHVVYQGEKQWSNHSNTISLMLFV